MQFLSSYNESGADELSAIDFKGEVPRLVLHRNPLARGEFFQRPLPIESADAGCFFSSERDQRLIVDGSVVHVDHPGIDLFGKFRSRFNVAGVNRSTEPKRTFIGNADGFFGCVEWHYTH